jgi:hypothetical protein
MVRIPFFGGDDDEPKTKEEVDGVTVTSNRNIEVNTASVDDIQSGDADLGGLNVHAISIGGDEGSPSETEVSRTSSTDTPSTPDTEPVTPSSASVTPDDSTTSYSRGTFVLPNDRDFMQKLEARGINGHQRIVETVYVLTGPTYTHPTDLIRLDNEEYYGSATRSSVSFNPYAMADKVANLYPDGEAPKLIARFHTHPSGTVKPSDQDKQSAKKVRSTFENAFGTDDFEFFHGIHGIEKHGSNPNPNERQAPTVQSDTLQWSGEQFHHKLAVYGRQFQPPRKNVAIAQED